MNRLWFRAAFTSLGTLSLTGALSAQTPCFSSTGGPNGDFDWVVHTGEIFFFDTTLTMVVGGPNGVPTATQTCVNGLIELRNLIVEPGGSIRVQGPNPMRIQASGDVFVRGTIDVSGFSGRDVATLNTGNQIERGGAGSGGGGWGGNANVNTTGPSTRGGRGQGPFGELDTGAQGGESSVAPGALGKDARRPGGGGGARFAADRVSNQTPSTFSLAAADGNNGHPLSVGAETGLSPAQGGEAGAGAFSDARANNDFFGTRPILGAGGQLLGLIRGELSSLWAGYGGGGGGNAMQTFPNPNWNFGSDEKGGPGGGGGGALHVQALGKIIFGSEGLIRTNGARGGTGENTNFLDHIGGTGGAGSGGHVVLESAEQIDFTDGGLNANALPRDWVTAYGQARKTGPLGDVNVCCRAYSNGGASSGGVLQLHVPDPTLPPGSNLATSQVVIPTALVNQRRPLDGVSSPEAYLLFPTCDPLPRLPTRWLGISGLSGTMHVPMVVDDAEEQDAPVALFSLELPRRP
jgi:hypothetical protein